MCWQIDITNTESRYQPLWWLAFIVLFTVLNLAGVELSFNVQLGFTFLSLLVLLVFYVGALLKFDFNKVSVKIAVLGLRWNQF